MQKKYIALTVILIAAALIALLAKPKATQQSTTNNDTDIATPTPTVTTDTSNQAPINSGEDAPEGSIHNLPVPQAVAAVRAKVAQEQNVAESKVVILEALEQEWSDGCLGLGGPAESCIQMITPGYRVVATAKGKEFTYRTNIDGSVIRAE